MAISCMKPSISLRLTEATDLRPSKGMRLVLQVILHFRAGVTFLQIIRKGV